MNEPTIPKIKKAVADGFEVSIQEIDSRIKRHPIALARQCVYYYTRKLLGMKYDDMEEKFDRDHSNLIYACHQIRDRRIYHWETKAMLEICGANNLKLQRLEFDPYISFAVVGD